MRTTAVLLAAAAHSAFETKYPVNDVLDHTPRYRSDRGVVVSVGMVDNRWPNCTVPYLMLTDLNCMAARVNNRYAKACDSPFVSESSALSTARSLISNAAAEVQAKTQPLGCTFTELSISQYNNSGDADYVLFVVSKPDTCHVHHVGFSRMHPNVMSLGWCFNNLPSIKHELMHVLGLEHEHQSPESTPYLTRCKTTSCKPNNFNCRALPKAAYVSHGPMDFRSIMMYPVGWQGACSLELTQAGVALANTQGFEHPTDQVGHVSSISDGDGAAIVAHYQAQGPALGMCSGYHNRVPACPESSSTQCVSLHIIGDGECDAETKCYDNDGGDCAENLFEEEETQQESSSTSSQSSSTRRGAALAAVVIMCVAIAGLVVFVLWNRKPSKPKYEALVSPPRIMY